MRIQDLIIGIIIFALFMVTMLNFAYQVNTGLGVDVDNDTAVAFTAFEQNAKTTQTNIYGVAVNMQNNSIGGSNVQSDTSKTYNDNIIGTGVRVVTLASSSFTIIGNSMDVIAAQAKVPPAFIYAFWIIIVIIIIMIFASSVLYNRL
jgi:hypothetical protein